LWLSVSYLRSPPAHPICVLSDVYPLLYLRNIDRFFKHSIPFASPNISHFFLPNLVKNLLRVKPFSRLNINCNWHNLPFMEFFHHSNLNETRRFGSRLCFPLQARKAPNLL
jgi:hypothetical protein